MLVFAEILCTIRRFPKVSASFFPCILSAEGKVYGHTRTQTYGTAFDVY
jgi:predicted nucleic-acid-binding protein